MTWDAAKPAGSSKIRDGDDAIRSNWQALEDALDREHEFPGVINGSAGYHKIPVLTANPTGAEGRLAIVNDQLKHYSNSSWRFASFPSGTKLPFFQASAPLGWTIDNTVNDKVLRVVDDAGGGSGGSWTLSGVTVDEHILIEDEIPSHFHATTCYSTGVGNIGVGGGSSVSTSATSATGGGLGHDHGLTSDAVWRPAYIDVIVCSKD